MQERPRAVFHQTRAFFHPPRLLLRYSTRLKPAGLLLCPERQSKQSALLVRRKIMGPPKSPIGFWGKRKHNEAMSFFRVSEKTISGVRADEVAVNFSAWTLLWISSSAILPECNNNNAVLYGKIYISTAQFTEKAHGQLCFSWLVQRRPLPPSFKINSVMVSVLVCIQSECNRHSQTSIGLFKFSSVLQSCKRGRTVVLCFFSMLYLLHSILHLSHL